MDVKFVRINMSAKIAYLNKDMCCIKVYASPTLAPLSCITLFRKINASKHAPSSQTRDKRNVI